VKNTSANIFFTRFLFYFLVVVFYQFFALDLQAQNIPVGSLLDDRIRSFQLMGKLDSSISLCVRPFSANKDLPLSGIYRMIDGEENSIYQKPIQFAGKLGKFSLLPVTLIQQYNTHHPYGWNDGAMIPSKGYQAMVSAGFYASLGPLEIQIQPEFVTAFQKPYAANSDYGNNVSGQYKKVFGGQSSVSLSFGAVSAGVSTANLWWGPGQVSSLLMSNNAPGFLHAYFRSKRPIRTGIGNFEWQLIGGKIVSDNDYGYENYNLRQRNFQSDWRYLNAMVISYQPKWVPGLFVGFTRALQRYNTDLNLGSSAFMKKYLPILTLPFQKVNAFNDDNLKTDQLASFFLKWVLSKVKAEFYIEYGFNDYGVNVRDYIMAPTHSAAYLAGFKKIIPSTNTSTYFELNAEITQMTQSADFLVRDAGNWYVHVPIVQGYTNNNQIIGAGAGLGCNVQTLQGTFVKGWKQLGLLFERVERDPQYHTNHWVDLSIGFLPQYKYKNMVLSGKFQFINSSNYAWEKDVNQFNLHSRLSIQYLF